MEYWSIGKSEPNTTFHSSDLVDAAAFRGFRLVSAREPVDVLSRAIAYHAKLGTAHVLKLDFDGVAGIQRLQTFVECSRGDDVAWAEPSKFRQPGDLIRNLVRHRAGIVVLPRLAVVPRLDDDVVRIGNLVLCDNPRPAATVSVLTFANEVRAAHEPAGGNVEERDIAENIIQRLGFGDILRGFSDDVGELSFRLVDHSCRNVSQFDGFAWADQIRRLVEIFVWKIIRGASGSVDIVAEGGDALAGTGKGRAQFDAGQRHAILLRKNFFESPTVLAPSFNDFFDHALRPLGLARAHAVAHIDNHVFVFDDADSVVVES